MQLNTALLDFIRQRIGLSTNTPMETAFFLELTEPLGDEFSKPAMMLDAMLKIIRETNPYLLRMITGNRDAFFRVLTGKPSTGFLSQIDDDDLTSQAEGVDSIVTHLTPDDKEAIEKVKNLGWRLVLLI